jgi:hypothetical protein
MHHGKVTDKIPEKMNDTTRIFIPESSQFPVGSSGIKGEDGFQMRRLLFGHEKLFGSKTGYPDHPDIAVTPRLLGNPLDQIVGIPFS